MSANWESVNKAMKSESFEQSQEAYNKWAASYSKDLEFMGQSTEPYVAEFTSLVNSDETERMAVLDLAAGSGRIGAALRRNKFKGKLHALDANKVILNKARKTGAYDAIIHQIVEAGTKLDTPINQYDFVFCVGALHFNHLPYETANIVWPTLKKGGYFIFTYRTTEDNKIYIEKFKNVLSKFVDDGFMKKITKKECLAYDSKDPQTGEFVVCVNACYQKLG